MRLGIISDTHGVVPRDVFDVFEQVDHIIHAGDLGTIDVFTELGAIAPVTAVYGNVDGFDLRDRLPKVAREELSGLFLTVTHGDQFGELTPAALHREFPDADIVVFGHTHRAELELVDKTVTVMNPGSATHPRGGMPPSVGIMELEPGLPPRARIVAI